MTTLNKLLPGERARILRLTGVDALKKRFIEMGLRKGTLVCAVRVAPLGDPIEVGIKGSNISIRKSEASHIVVEKIEKE